MVIMFPIFDEEYGPSLRGKSFTRIREIAKIYENNYFKGWESGLGEGLARYICLTSREEAEIFINFLINEAAETHHKSEGFGVSIISKAVEIINLTLENEALIKESQNEKISS